jgi:hypothetical protein
MDAKTHWEKVYTTAYFSFEYSAFAAMNTRFMTLAR